MTFGLENYIQNEYIRAIILLVGIFVVLKLFVFIIEKIVIKFTKKTQTDLDDKIIEKTSSPISLLILIIGIRIAVEEITAVQGNFEKIFNNIIYSLIIIVGGFIIYRVVDLVVARAWKRVAIKTKSNIDENLYSIVHGLLNFLWIIFVFLYVLTLWGIQVGPFLAGLGIAGIAVALALQPILSNIFSGISIVLDKTIRAGDLVYIEDKVKGKILEIGLRSTKIMTFDNELIIIPNSKLSDSIIQNVTLPEPKSRVIVPFSVAYGTDIEKVRKIVLSEISKIKHVSHDPSPIVRFVEMANSSLNFKAYFHVDSFDNRFEAIDEANTRIYNALNKNKIKIPFPTMDINLKKN
ncbi:hypothetical protein COU57_06320 [Candidatus Pacearchaeota archaeon CG10_big_fil_rev_8_21_14_0_10_32_14]|nr:MAG: hypothetical protein COU57_06320 [Candidatus Pacearchaeota archaeon CG10_big_fil_rev_8_21_14_0_10_32_14]